MVGRHGNTSVLPSTRSETASPMSETAVAILGRALADLEDIAAVTGWARENSPRQETGEYRAPHCSRASMNTAARTLIFGGAGFIGGAVAARPRELRVARAVFPHAPTTRPPRAALLPTA